MTATVFLPCGGGLHRAEPLEECADCCRPVCVWCSGGEPMHLAAGEIEDDSPEEVVLVTICFPRCRESRQ